MKFDSITDTYKEHSEDIYGFTTNCFWVLDGALSLSKANYTNTYSDIVWMVNWWNTYLKKHIEQFDKSIHTILEEGIDLLNIDFGKFTDNTKLSNLDRSTSSILVVRINKKLVETYVLGDSEINIRYKNGKIDTLIDDKIETLDNEVIDLIFNNIERKDFITFNGYTDKELQILRNNRMKINRKDGYYILEHRKEVIKYGLYKEYKISEIQDILLMTDGYSAIYNKYNQLTLEELMNKSREEGLKPVMNNIREIESDDHEFKKYKRLRLHDDATAIYIDLPN